MMRRILPVLATLTVVAACAPQVPDSGEGVGFGDYGDYSEYRRVRESQLKGNPAETRGAPPVTVVAPAAPPRTEAEAVASDALAAIGAPQRQVASAPAAGPAATPAPAATAAPARTVQPASSNPRISDEQDFQAVSGRESIESDRQRLAAQREAYQVIEPEALPTRRGPAGPNIVQFALSTNNRVGEPVYRRVVLNRSKAERACARFPSSDQAQIAFLEAGGPQRDRLGVDPDGDGFACSWDPTPFRQARAARR